MTSGKQEILAPADKNHSVDINSLPTSALRGIIEKLNERSQTATRLFRDSYSISVEDIRQLMDKVVQEFHSCTIIARTATVSLLLSRNERHDFRSWADFEGFDTSQSGRTNSIQVEMTLDVVRNVGESAERYVVQLSVQNMQHSMGFFLGAISVGHIGEFPTPPAPISATVKYNNYILGKNILGTIEQWEKSLERTEKVWISRLQKYSRQIAELAVIFGVVAGIISAASITSIYSTFELPVLSLEQWLVRAALCVVVFGYVGKVSGELSERAIDRYALSNNFTLTKGDRNHQAKIAKSNIKTLLRAFLGVGLVGLELVLGVWAAELVPSISSLF